ncbi:MAG: ribonuclease P protein component [Thermoflavifilum sp.]|nr:ribonuclease P protein component [Thermoflavifilum sp.]
MLIRYTFKKAERLKKRKLIEQLFAQGRSLSVFPFKAFCVFPSPSVQDSHYPAQVAFSVPGRYFRKATQRNRIKRLMREAYRLEKHRLYTYLLQKQMQLHWIIIYQGKEMPTFEEVRQKMQILINRVMQLEEGENHVHTP